MASMACELGAQDYLVKAGLNQTVLLRAVRCAIGRKRHEARLTEWAYTDAVTGLANRRLFCDRLTHALVRAARDDSYEGCSRDAGIPAFFLETGTGQNEDIRAELAEPLLERAIGVIYRPESELHSHYFQAELSRQFDAWIWFTETEAVAARPSAYVDGPDETYPFGL